MVRQFRPILVATAIGATTLFAAPALAETTVQHKDVALYNDDEGQSWPFLRWTIRQLEARTGDGMNQVPDAVSDVAPYTAPGVTPYIAPGVAPGIAPGAVPADTTGA
jgi:hypothetical protein